MARVLRSCCSRRQRRIAWWSPLSSGSGTLGPANSAGAGVVGVVEEAAGTVLGTGNAFDFSGDFCVGYAEAFELAAGFVAEDTGKQAHGCVDDYGGGELASREDVVAYG